MSSSKYGPDEGPLATPAGGEMGAGIGGGDDGLRKLAAMASLAVLRASNRDDSKDSGVSTFFGIGSGDLRCFSMEWHFEYAL